MAGSPNALSEGVQETLTARPGCLLGCPVTVSGLPESDAHPIDRFVGLPDRCPRADPVQ